MIRRPPNKRAPTTQQVTSVSEGGDISSAWEGLGIKQGFEPLPLSRARFLMGGFVKDGKSTLMASRPRTLILDFEDAVRNVRGAKAHYIPIVSWNSLQKVLEQLRSQAQRGVRDFDHVVVDTLDRYADIECDKICEEEKKSVINEVYGGKGGYSLWQKRVAGFFRELYRMGYGWTAVSHLKWANGSDQNGKEIQYVRHGPIPSLIQALQQDADYLCQIGSEIVNEEQPDPRNPKMKIRVPRRRVLLTTKEGTTRAYNAEVGSRVPLSEFLEIPLHDGWSVVEADWERAAAECKAEDAELRGV